jgi:hypothetical protein
MSEEGPVKLYFGPCMGLRWMPSPGATKYRAYYKVGNGTINPEPITFQISTTGVLSTEVPGGGHYHGYVAPDGTSHYLDEGSEYSYYVEAWNSYGWSDKGYIGKATALITYETAQVGGGNASPTTGIVFRFTTEPLGLTAADIKITNGTGAVTKGNLTGSGTLWTISLTVITKGTVDVSIDKSSIDTGVQTITVFK